MSKLSNYDFFKLLGFQKYNFSSKYPSQSVEFQNLLFLSWLECGILGEIRTSKRVIFEYLLTKRRRNTVWKFHDFSAIQILREINFGD